MVLAGAINEAVILVGGQGTRLKSVVNDRPKSMAEVCGRPFVEWLVLALRQQGVTRLIFCAGHLGQVIEAHFGDGKRFGTEIICARELMPLGTAGALRYALDLIRSDRLVVLNGDSYCRVDLRQLLQIHQDRGALATLWLVPAEDSGRYGSVDIDSQGRVCGFREKTAAARPGLINAGVYLLERSVVGKIPRGRAVSLETEVFPGLVGSGLYAVVGKGPFVDIGTPQSYETASRMLQDEFAMLDQGMKKGASQK